jgi:hypothetical protein
MTAETGPIRPEIDMSRIRVGGGAAGFIFAAGTVYIFVTGVPAIRGFFAAAAALGVLLSVALHVVHKLWPARPVTRIPL